MTTSIVYVVIIYNINYFFFFFENVHGYKFIEQILDYFLDSYYDSVLKNYSNRRTKLKQSYYVASDVLYSCC